MSVKYTEKQLVNYEQIMQEIPNYKKGGGKMAIDFKYKSEDCQCCYCLYFVKRRCILDECMLSEVMDCIELS